MAALNEAYPDYSIKFSEKENKIKCITKRIKIACERLGYSYEKWKPARLLSEWIRLGDERITEETKQRFEDLFTTGNKMLK